MTELNMNSQKEITAWKTLSFWKLVVFGLPAMIFLLALTRFVFHIPFSNWVIVLVISLFGEVYLLTRLRAGIFFILLIILTMIELPVILYFFMPFLINVSGGAALLFLCYIFFIGNIFNLSLSSSFLYIFLAISSFSSFILILIEYLGAYPLYRNYTVNNYFLADKDHLLAALIVVVGGFFFLAFNINNFLAVLKEKIEALNKVKKELFEVNLVLEERIRERAKELEEAKSVLEIKVQARKEELNKLASNLEEQVKERNKELEEKIAALKEINRFTIEREIKVVEIKKGIKNPNI